MASIQMGKLLREGFLLKEKHPKTGEGDPKGDWQKQFADHLNTDAEVLAAKLDAIPCTPQDELEEEEK